MVMPVLLVLGQPITMSTLTPPPDESTPKDEREQLEKTQDFLNFLLLILASSCWIDHLLVHFQCLYFEPKLIGPQVLRSHNPPKIKLPEYYWDALEDMENMTAVDERKAAEAGIAVGPKWEDSLAGMFTIWQSNQKMDA